MYVVEGEGKGERSGGGGHVFEECVLGTLRQIATKEESDRGIEEMNSASRGVWAKTRFITLMKKKKTTTIYFEC